MSAVRLIKVARLDDILENNVLDATRSQLLTLVILDAYRSPRALKPFGGSFAPSAPIASG